MQTKITSWFIVWLAGSAVFLQLATSPAATADTLNLVQTFPDIMAINLDLGYSASTGMFSVFGKADQLDLAGGSPPGNPERQ